MTIHAIFDLLAWLLALGIRYYYYRVGDFGQTEIPERLCFQHKLVLLAGASMGALVVGTFNLRMQYPNLLGHSVLGAIMGGILTVELFKLLYNIKGSTGVVWVVPLSVGIAIGRVGCYLSGLPDYTYGIPTALPWGVDFGDGVIRHPVQLYETFAMLFFAGIAALAIHHKSRWFRCNGFYVFAVYYATQRFAWEFLKPYAKLWWQLNIFHFLCMVLMGYGFLMMRRRRQM